MTLSSDGDNGRGLVQGVPVTVENEPDTGRLSTSLRMRIAAANPGGMGDEQVTLRKLAKLIADETGKNGGGNGGPKKPSFLGLEVGAWTKQLLALLAAALVALGVWQLTVRDELSMRPTGLEVKQESKATFDVHNDSSAAHPPIQKRLDTLTSEQRLIRDSQIGQAADDKAQTKVLDEIKADVKILRRRRGR